MFAPCFYTHKQKEFILYSFYSLFTDSKNFILNAWKIIFTVTAIFLFLNELALHLTEPSESAINALFMQYHINGFADIMSITAQDQMTQTEFFRELFQLLKSFLFFTIIFSLLNLATFPALISIISKGQFQLKALLQLISNNFLSIILFCITLFIISFFCSFLIMIYMPILYLCVLFLFTLTLLFQTVLIAKPELNFGSKLKICFTFLKKESALIALGLGAYIIVYLAFNVLVSFISDTAIAQVIVTFILLLVNQFILVYLYRLFSLSVDK